MCDPEPRDGAKQRRFAALARLAAGCAALWAGSAQAHDYPTA